MSIPLITALILGALLVMMVTGLPVTFCLLFISGVGFIAFRGLDSTQVMFLSGFGTLINDVFIAIPLFVFMACVLEVSGVGSALYEMFHKWMAGLRGGLAMATIAVSTIIAAMTGSVATATITMGILAYPEMEQRGYDKHLVIGCIPAGGALGPLIPPSIIMIIVAAVSWVSIGKLFIAGVFPGLISAFLFMGYIAIRCWKNPRMGPALPPEERASWGEKLKSLQLSGLPILLIFLVLGLIYTGVCTPTEAGGVGAFGALICSAVYRNLNWKNLQHAVMRTLGITAMVLWLLIAAYMFSSLIGMIGVTNYIKDFLTGLRVNPWVIIIGMFALGFVLGMFMDCGPIIVIFLPIFVPVVAALGFDLLWFCLVFSIDMIIATITPPFGMCLFIFKGLNIPGVTIMDVYRGIIPFVILMTITMILCTIFPEIAVWLPHQMIGK